MVDCNTLKTILRGLIVSNHEVMTVDALCKDYTANMGEGIPFWQLGFGSLAELLYSLTDTLKIRGNNVYAVCNEEIAHVQSLVSLNFPQRSSHGGKPQQTMLPDSAFSSYLIAVNSTTGRGKRTSRPCFDGERSKARLSLPICELTAIKYDEKADSVSTDFSQRRDKKEKVHTSSRGQYRRPNRCCVAESEYDSRYDPYKEFQVANRSEKNPPYGKRNNNCPEQNSSCSLDINDLLGSNIASENETRACHPDSEQHDILITPKLKKNLLDIIEEYPSEGLWCNRLAEAYLFYNGRILDSGEYGFVSMNEMARTLPDVFRCVRGNNGVPPPDKLLTTSSDLESETLYIQPEVPAKVEERIQSILSIKSKPMRPDDFNVNYTDEVKNILPPTACGPQDKCPEVTIPDSIRLEPYILVRLLQIYNPKKFWLHIYHNKDDKPLDSFMDELQDYYSEKEREYKAPSLLWRKGDHCVGLYDGVWHRCVVLSLKDKLHVKVQYFDYGTIAVAKRSDLRLLDKRFSDFPMQAIKGKLSAITPANGAKHFSRDANVFFFNLVAQKKLVASLTRICHSPPFLALLLVDTQGGYDVHITDELVEKGFAEFTLAESDWEWEGHSEDSEEEVDFSTKPVETDTKKVQSRKYPTKKVKHCSTPKPNTNEGSRVSPVKTQSTLTTFKLCDTKTDVPVLNIINESADTITNKTSDMYNTIIGNRINDKCGDASVPTTHNPQVPCARNIESLRAVVRPPPGFKPLYNHIPPGMARVPGGNELYMNPGNQPAIPPSLPTGMPPLVAPQGSPHNMVNLTALNQVPLSQQFAMYNAYNRALQSQHLLPQPTTQANYTWEGWPMNLAPAFHSTFQPQVVNNNPACYHQSEPQHGHYYTDMKASSKTATTTSSVWVPNLPPATAAADRSSTQSDLKEKKSEESKSLSTVAPTSCAERTSKSPPDILPPTTPEPRAKGLSVDSSQTSLSTVTESTRGKFSETDAGTNFALMESKTSEVPSGRTSSTSANSPLSRNDGCGQHTGPKKPAVKEIGKESAVPQPLQKTRQPVKIMWQPLDVSVGVVHLLNYRNEAYVSSDELAQVCLKLSGHSALALKLLRSGKFQVPIMEFSRKDSPEFFASLDLCPGLSEILRSEEGKFKLNLIPLKNVVSALIIAGIKNGHVVFKIQDARREFNPEDDYWKQMCQN